MFKEITRKDQQLQEVQEELLQQKKLTEELNQMKEEFKKASEEQKVRSSTSFPFRKQTIEISFKK